jgi:hypothetical protein
VAGSGGGRACGVGERREEGRGKEREKKGFVHGTSCDLEEIGKEYYDELI